MSKENRTAIITGAYGAIGQAIAEGVALKGYRVILVGRDQKKLEQTCSMLKIKSKNEDVRYETVDLGLKRDIEVFANRWNEPLHLLINNAATAPRTRTETSEGIEVQWATNVLGYYWMTQHFHPFMAGLPDARIVNVASYWAGGLDFHDLQFRNRPYDNDVAYRQAKQANRMISAVFAERLKQHGIMVNACHPGDVNSKLSNAFGFGGSETPAEGAATPLYLVLSPEMAGITGKYYEHLNPVQCQFCRDADKIDELFNLVKTSF